MSTNIKLQTAVCGVGCDKGCYLDMRALKIVKVKGTLL